MTNIASPKIQELAEEYLELKRERAEAIGKWIAQIQEHVDAGEISYEAASLAIEFKAMGDSIRDDPEDDDDPEEWYDAYEKTLKRGFMFPDWRPDRVGTVDVLERPSSNDTKLESEE